MTRIRAPRLERLEDRLAPAVNLHPVYLRGTDWLSVEWTALSPATTYHLSRTSDDPTDFDGEIYSGPAAAFVDAGPHLRPGVVYQYTVTADSDPAPSSTQSATLATPTAANALTGFVVANAGGTEVFNRVTIQAVTGRPIDPAAPTWLIAHGRNGRAADFADLAAALRQARPGEQVLTIDWADGAASGLIGDRGEYFIEPTAEWAFRALGLAGMPAAKLNLVGHSWGAYVAGELAERYDVAAAPATDGGAWGALGAVNTIVGLDPGLDYPNLGYNPNNSIGFSDHARWSWAFHDATGVGQPFVLGSVRTPATAHEAFVVQGSNHGGIITLFTDLVRDNADPHGNTTLAERFDLGRLLAASHDPTRTRERFQADGTAGGDFPKYDAVLATANHELTGLSYFQPGTAAAPVSRAAATGLTVTGLTGTAAWGKVDLVSTLRNVSGAATAAGTATFYASLDPGQHGVQYVLGTRPISALPIGQRSVGATTLDLPDLPDGTAVIYVALAINPTATPPAGELEWVAVPVGTTPLEPTAIATVSGPLTIEQGKCPPLKITAAATTINVYRGTQLVGVGSRTGDDWCALIPTAGWPLGDTRLTVEVIDDVAGTAPRVIPYDVTIVPAAGPNQLYAVAAGPGGGPHVRVFNADGSERYSFLAYAAAFTGGVRVATGDVTADGVADIITVPGPGGGPEVKVFDGATGALVRNFMAYDASFRGGVWVAGGDLDGDGRADIVTGADAGGGPHVQAFSGFDNHGLRSYFAYDASFRGGVRVGTGDVDGDGVADLLTAAGPDGGPHVRAVRGLDGAELADFFAYAPTFAGGIFVSAGDVDGDGRDDIITGAGTGGGPHVQVFSAETRGVLRSFFAADPAFTGGVRVATVDRDADGRADVVTGLGTGGDPRLKVFAGTTLQLLSDVAAYDPTFLGGVFVG